MPAEPRAVVDRYFKAMQSGRERQEDLLALFAEDAVYIEPFAGPTRTHVGLAAIRRCIEASWSYAPPDLRLTVDRIDVDGTTVRAWWTCSAPAFAAPVRGEDRYQIREGKIVHLEVRLLAPDPA